MCAFWIVSMVLCFIVLAVSGWTVAVVTFLVLLGGMKLLTRGGRKGSDAQTSYQAKKIISDLVEIAYLSGATRLANGVATSEREWMEMLHLSSFTVDLAAFSLLGDRPVRQSMAEAFHLGFLNKVRDEVPESFFRTGPGRLDEYGDIVRAETGDPLSAVPQMAMHFAKIAGGRSDDKNYQATGLAICQSAIAATRKVVATEFGLPDDVPTTQVSSSAEQPSSVSNVTLIIANALVAVVRKGNDATMTDGEPLDQRLLEEVMHVRLFAVEYGTFKQLGQGQLRDRLLDEFRQRLFPGLGDVGTPEFLETGAQRLAYYGKVSTEEIVDDIRPAIGHAFMKVADPEMTDPAIWATGHAEFSKALSEVAAAFVDQAGESSN